jgi:hypothetical protein
VRPLDCSGLGWHPCRGRARGMPTDLALILHGRPRAQCSVPPDTERVFSNSRNASGLSLRNQWGFWLVRSFDGN